MPLKQNKREQPEEGTHIARIARVSDLGHQPPWEWKGEKQPSNYKLDITYELINAKMSDGRPFFVTEELVFSDHEQSSLSTRLKATDSDGANIASLLNKPVMVTVRHTEKGNAKIAGKGGVSGVPAGMEVPPLANPMSFFDPYSDNVDIEEFESFPEFKQQKFRDALDFAEMTLSRRLAEEDKF